MLKQGRARIISGVSVEWVAGLRIEHIHCLARNVHDLSKVWLRGGNTLYEYLSLYLASREPKIDASSYLMTSWYQQYIIFCTRTLSFQQNRMSPESAELTHFFFYLLEFTQNTKKILSFIYLTLLHIENFFFSFFRFFLGRKDFSQSFLFNSTTFPFLLTLVYLFIYIQRLILISFLE